LNGNGFRKMRVILAATGYMFEREATSNKREPGSQWITYLYSD